MKLKLFYVLAFLCSALMSQAQVSGLKAIPDDYPDLATAINDINTQGVGAGGVVIHVLEGNPQTAPAGGYVITATGTSLANNILISGGGNDIVASPNHTVGSVQDAVFKIIGSDFITIYDCKIKENPLNTEAAVGSNTMTEFGIALLNDATTNGCQNVELFKNEITLNRTYTNTFGIYSNNVHSKTDFLLRETATGPQGGNHNLSIKGNVISNVNYGVLVIGPDVGADHLKGLVIGGNEPENANTITDYGTGQQATVYAGFGTNRLISAILLMSTDGYQVVNNTLTSSNAGVSSSANNLLGISQIGISSANQSVLAFTNTISNNVISLTAGLNVAMRAISLGQNNATNTSTLHINNNRIVKLANTSATSNINVSGILVDCNPKTFQCNNNTLENIVLTMFGGTFSFISHSYVIPTGGSQEISFNKIVGTFTKTDLRGNINFLSTTAGYSANTSVTYIGNDFSNITCLGEAGLTGIFNLDGNSNLGGGVRIIKDNVFKNWTSQSGIGSGSFVGINIGYFGGDSVIENNTIENFNSFLQVTGIIAGNSGVATYSNSLKVSNNKISQLNSIGNGAFVTGINCGYNANTVEIYNNQIDNLFSAVNSVSNPVSGIIYAGASPNAKVYANKVYNLSGDKANTTINGIALGGSASNLANVTAYNNRISNLTTPNATTYNAIRGINVEVVDGKVNLYHNTVYLNASSTSTTTFGTSAVFVKNNLNKLICRNNIFTNLSVPAQNSANLSTNGASVIIRFSSGTNGIVPTNYGIESNNNAFYVNSTAGVNNHLVYAEGTSNTLTNSLNTLGQFKTFLVNAEQSSVEENPNFLSSLPTDATYLKVDTTIATALEKGGIGLPNVAVDFENEARNTSTPDIGADEFDGIVIDNVPPSISFNPIQFKCAGEEAVLVAKITDASGVPTSGVGLPVLYWKKNEEAWNAVTATSLGNDDFQFNFASNSSVNDKISYYLVAQDNQVTPSVVAFPNAGTTGLTANPPASATPATASYSYISGMSGTYTIGASGYFKTLKEAFDALDNNCIAGSLTYELIDANYTTSGITIKNNNYLSASKTLTIKPTVTSTITGNSEYATFALLGAKYVTIDGSIGNTNGRNLTILNTNTLTNTNSAVIWMTIGNNIASSNNTIKNCILSGSTPTNTFTAIGYGRPIISVLSPLFPTENNSFINNDIRKVQYGIYTIGNETIFNKNTNISNNIITSVAPNNIAYVGIVGNCEDGIIIKGNEIDNIPGNGNNTSGGIMLGRRNSSNPSFILSESGTIALCSNAVVTENKIGKIASSGTSGSAVGITLLNGTKGTSTIANNMISGVTSKSTTSNEAGVGIFSYANDGGKVNIWNNTVSMSGALATGNQASYALAINGTANAQFNIQNNILSNTQANGTAKNYVIGFGMTGLANVTCNNNNLSTLVAPNNFIGSTVSLLSATRVNQTTFQDWKTATAKEVNSKNISPTFVSLSDLHLTNTHCNADLNGTASVLPMVVNDIDNQTRTVTSDMGADEFDIININGVSQVGNILTATEVDVTYQWGSVDGNNVFTAISGETNQSFTTTQVGNYAVVVTKNGCPQQSATYEVSVKVNLKLFLEGYYDTAMHKMFAVKQNQGQGTNPNLVDTITLELRNANDGVLVVSKNIDLMTDGTAQADFDFSINGNYYVVVKHRNTIQTWSKTPVTIGTTPLNYDFTNAVNKAYGDNMKEVELGVYAFYSGDFNQDEVVDPVDFSLWETDSNNFAYGVFSTDLNGDGVVDPLDYPVWEVNAENFIFSIYPIFNN